MLLDNHRQVIQAGKPQAAALIIAGGGPYRLCQQGHAGHGNGLNWQAGLIRRGRCRWSRGRRRAAGWRVVQPVPFKLALPLGRGPIPLKLPGRRVRRTLGMDQTQAQTRPDQASRQDKNQAGFFQIMTCVNAVLI